jgi:hypothetical protein
LVIRLRALQSTPAADEYADITYRLAIGAQYAAGDRAGRKQRHRETAPLSTDLCAHDAGEAEEDDQSRATDHAMILSPFLTAQLRTSKISEVIGPKQETAACHESSIERPGLLDA